MYYVYNFVPCINFCSVGGGGGGNYLFFYPGDIFFKTKPGHR